MNMQFSYKQLCLRYTHAILRRSYFPSSSKPRILEGCEFPNTGRFATIHGITAAGSIHSLLGLVYILLSETSGFSHSVFATWNQQKHGVQL